MLEGADHDADQFKFEPLSSEEAVNEVTVPGTVVPAETLAVLENAEADPPEFVAVTLQRIGLAYPRALKFEGGEYEELVAPEILKYVLPWSKYCHWYAYEVGELVHVPVEEEYVVVPAVPDVGVTEGAEVFAGIAGVEVTTFELTSEEVPPAFVAVAKALK